MNERELLDPGMLLVSSSPIWSNPAASDSSQKPQQQRSPLSPFFYNILYFEFQVENFFTEHPLPGSERNVAQSVETIRLHAAWLSRDAADISNFFKNH